MTIPLTKPWMGDREAEAVADVIASGWVAQGPKVAEFERSFARYVGAQAAVAVSSATAGLHLVLHAHGIGPGDEVVVPSLSYIATANSVVHAGATPVFADVDRQSLCMTRDTIAAAISERTRAVMVVHQLGMPASIGPIRDLCSERGLFLLEDAACAIGTECNGELVGMSPGVAVFSFHPRKLLSTGEGGMVTVPSDEMGARLRRLRSHAMSHSAYDRARGEPLVESYDELGFNYRMTDVQAAIGLVQMQRLDEILRRRREQADLYARGLAELGLTVARDTESGRTNYQSYWMLLESGDTRRDHVLAALTRNDIRAKPALMASHRERVYQSVRWRLPVTEDIADHGIVLPLFHTMTEAEQERVVDAVTGAMS